MKHIKTYESQPQHISPKVKDYVILWYEQNKIGQIINIEDDYNSIKVELENEFGIPFYIVTPSNIKCWSPNKEDLEELIAKEKYNL